MHKYLHYIIAALLLTGCRGGGSNPDAGGKPVVAVTIAPLHGITRDIAGSGYEVITLLDRGANPETFEPSMKSLAAAGRSALMLTVGAFPFERTVAEANARTVKSVDATEGITRLYGTHSHHHAVPGHSCGEADPHVWTSARNMRKIALNIGKALAENDPGRAHEYLSRADSVAAVIDSLDLKLTRQLEASAGKPFAIWHPSLSYLANDYGLVQIAVGEESKEVSPARLRSIIDRAGQGKVKVFFFQKEFDSRQASSLNDQLQARMVTIDPLSAGWMEQLQIIADEISRN